MLGDLGVVVRIEMNFIFISVVLVPPMSAPIGTPRAEVITIGLAARGIGQMRNPCEVLRTSSKHFLNNLPPLANFLKDVKFKPLSHPLRRAVGEGPRACVETPF